jgi:nicotinamide-nucleotide amidase
MVPAAARILRNPDGTAPGYHFTRDEKHFFVMPGVPYEMHGMVERNILPMLRASFDGSHLSHTILTTGIPESTLSDILRGIETHTADTRVAYLPSPAGVRIRLTALARQQETGYAALETLRSFVQDRAGEYIFGSGKETLESVVGTMLASAAKTLAVAESCTGGLITDRITNVPGSSIWFDRGIVCYSNASKTDMLGVPAPLIETHGAVSREVAEAMAEGIRRVSGCAIGIATTGIAGPSGGSEAKPIGLVWISLSTDSNLVSHSFYFGDHRMRTKQRAAQAAMDMVRRSLLDLPPIPSNLTEAT